MPAKTRRDICRLQVIGELLEECGKFGKRSGLWDSRDSLAEASWPERTIH